MPALLLFRRGDSDLNVAAEIVEKAHQAIGREAVESAIDDAGYFGLIQPEQIGGLGLGQLASLDGLADMQG